MDEQLLQSLLASMIPTAIKIVTVASTEEHPTHGLLVNVTAPSWEGQLIPMWIGRKFDPVLVGDRGLALIADGEADQGFYVSGNTLLGQLAEAWDPSNTRIEARGDLEARAPEGSILIDAASDIEIDGGGEIRASAPQGILLQGGGEGAARVGDGVRITIPAGPSAAVTQLGVALLTTGLFTPNPAPPPVPPSATVASPIAFDGEITEGSEEVKIGG